MKWIYKYEISLVGCPRLDLPKGAQILSFQTQNKKLVIWVVVDPTASREKREFVIYGNGQGIAEDLRNLNYIGTTQQSSDPPLVWHLFEKKRR